MKIIDRFQHAWNAFFNKDPTGFRINVGPGNYGAKPDTHRYRYGADRTILNSVFTRLSLDVSQIKFRHIITDNDERYLRDADDGLNRCLKLSANWDQTGRGLIQDIVQSMLDEGVVAVVPVLTDTDPNQYESLEIYELRTGRITAWYPRHVKVEVYNEEKGKREEILMPKDSVAIIENPFYSIVNEPNSTVQRLKRKLALLDITDERNSSGKLDLIIQLPFALKGELKKQQAKERKAEIENQLVNSPYGIAYLDTTEHVTQLNRPVDNQLMAEVQSLTSELFMHFGITDKVMDGSANEQEMLNYISRAIEPICSAISDEFTRKFLSRTAITQHHAVRFFRDAFKLVPLSELVKMADTMTRNEIMTSNEVRQIMGLKPSDDPEADQLRNKNLNAANNQGAAPVQTEPEAMGEIPMEEFQNG